MSYNSLRLMPDSDCILQASIVFSSTVERGLDP